MLGDLERTFWRWWWLGSNGAKISGREAMREVWQRLQMLAVGTFIGLIVWHYITQGPT